MKCYVLSDKGKKAFELMKESNSKTILNQSGYQILAHLYQRKTAGAEDVAMETGLQIKDAIQTLHQYRRQGVVEVLMDL